MWAGNAWVTKKTKARLHQGTPPVSTGGSIPATAEYRRYAAAATHTTNPGTLALRASEGPGVPRVTALEAVTLTGSPYPSGQQPGCTRLSCAWSLRPGPG